MKSKNIFILTLIITSSVIVIAIHENLQGNSSLSQTPDVPYIDFTYLDPGEEIGFAAEFRETEIHITLHGPFTN